MYKSVPTLENIDFRVEVNILPTEETMDPRIVATTDGFGSPITCCFGLEHSNDLPFAYWRPGYFQGVNNELMNNIESLIGEAQERRLDRSLSICAKFGGSDKDYFHDASVVAVGRFLEKTRRILAKYKLISSSE